MSLGEGGWVGRRGSKEAPEEALDFGCQGSCEGVWTRVETWETVPVLSIRGSGASECGQWELRALVAHLQGPAETVGKPSSRKINFSFS